MPTVVTIAVGVGVRAPPDFSTLIPTVAALVRSVLAVMTVRHDFGSNTPTAVAVPELSIVHS